MNEEKIKEIIGQYIDLSKKRNVVITKEIKNNGWTSLQIRDALLGKAKFLAEYGQSYLLEIDIKANPAIIFLDIQESTIDFCASANEGLIKQHTAEKGVNVVIKNIQSGLKKKQKL